MHYNNLYKSFQITNSVSSDRNGHGVQVGSKKIFQPHKKKKYIYQFNENLNVKI